MDAPYACGVRMLVLEGASVRARARGRPPDLERTRGHGRESEMAKVWYGSFESPQATKVKKCSTPRAYGSRYGA